MTDKLLDGAVEAADMDFGRKRMLIGSVGVVDLVDALSNNALEIPALLVSDRGG